MSREPLILEMVWFVAGPVLLTGALLNFYGDYKYFGGDSRSEIFYSYPAPAIFVAMLGFGLIAMGLVRGRRSRNLAAAQAADDPLEPRSHTAAPSDA